jgi:intracellular septation protein A
VRTLALQLLPLLVFIVVDAFVDDVRISIICAVVFAIVQLALTWYRTRRFDWFVVLDVALIVGMGGMSIAFENELFFKLKPAIIEGVSIVFMLGLYFSPDAFLAGYVGRMTPGLELKPDAIRPMRRMIAIGGLYVAVHTLTVLYTAFETSRETWSMVSGPGFYVGLAPLFLMGLIRRRKADAD